MYAKADEVLGRLPLEREQGLLPAIRAEFEKSGKTIVVLDDDPTGTQTCHDVEVLTSWAVPLLLKALEAAPSIFFILTNSRSLPEREAVTLATEVGKNLLEAVKKSGRQAVVISRSDSTLRGHFPAEVEAIAHALGIVNAVTVLVPAFLEGGRVTIDDVHYIREQDELVPVAETPFAQDTVFGYTHSNLKEWVEEKTRGAVSASDVVSISLKDLRLRGPEAVAEKLSACRGGDVCIVNACSYKDLEVLAMALLLAEKRGKTFLYRTSATFVPIRAGIGPGKLYRPKPGEARSENGSLVVVGSYVPKTTRQLAVLLGHGNHHSIEIDVPELLRSTDTTAYRTLIARQASDLISQGRNVVIHTSRRLETGKDAESTLLIHRAVSAFLVSIVRELSVRPAFIIGKGGITSSDLATKALSVTRAVILGQVIAGVPVWKLDSDSRFPEMRFVVFPGNVGDDHALSDVCELLRAPNGETSESMQTKPKT
jgi:uncharacterized protein YgbK (DUF1537 family)